MGSEEPGPSHGSPSHCSKDTVYRGAAALSGIAAVISVLIAMTPPTNRSTAARRHHSIASIHIDLRISRLRSEFVVLLVGAILAEPREDFKPKLQLFDLFLHLRRTRLRGCPPAHGANPVSNRCVPGQLHVHVRSGAGRADHWL